ncbi:unnamed protein product [Caenorhabditis nigoni]
MSKKFEFLQIPLAIFQASIAIPVSIKCTDKSCNPLVTLIHFFLVTGSLLITNIILSFVLISLLRHRKVFMKLDTESNASLNSAIRLLAWTLFAVILISIGEVIPFVFMEIRRHAGTITGCYWFYHASEIISEASFALIESSIWSVALIMDPLINVILDKTVSRQAKSQQIETSIIIAYVDYYSSVTLFSIAGLINIYCLLIIIPLYRKMQDGTKKKYIFLITRCIAGLLASCAWLLIQCIYLRFIAPTSGNFPYYVLALALYIGSTYVLLVILVSGSLVITIISLSFVLISLKRHRKQFKKLDTVSNTSLNSALRLLSWTLFAVILISVAEIIPFVFMEYKKHERPTSGCQWFNHASRLISEASFALIESSIWSVALIIDPLTNVILDTTVSNQATNQVKWARKSFVGLARKMTGKFPKRQIVEGNETPVCPEEQIVKFDTIPSVS